MHQRRDRADESVKIRASTGTLPYRRHAARAANGGHASLRCRATVINRRVESCQMRGGDYRGFEFAAIAAGAERSSGGQAEGGREKWSACSREGQRAAHSLNEASGATEPAATPAARGAHADPADNYKNRRCRPGCTANAACIESFSMHGARRATPARAADADGTPTIETFWTRWRTRQKPGVCSSCSTSPSELGSAATPGPT